MQKIYNYNKDGFYTGEGYAFPNPRLEGDYIIPANATTVKIPELTENQKARFNKIKNKWEIYTITATTENIINDSNSKEIRDMNLEEKVQSGITILSDYQKLNEDSTEVVDKKYSELINDGIKTLDEIKVELINELSDKINYLTERGKEFVIDGEKKYHKARTEDLVASQVVIERALVNNLDFVEKYRLFDEEGNSAWTSLTIEQITSMLSSCRDWVIFTLYTQRATIENEINGLTAEDVDDYTITISEV